MADNNNCSPTKFVKPADLFRMRHSTSSCPAFDNAQSPLKCLNNLAEPSPIKKLPSLLRNPFHKQTVKRRLNMSSPTKKTKLLELDEDANLEPPKMKPTSSISQQQQQQLNIKPPNSTQKPSSVHPICFRNSWILHTKIKINFNGECKNWLDSPTSTHHRSWQYDSWSPSKTPSKEKPDPSISIEAIKNAARVYQHPYLAWQKLYPRVLSDFETAETRSPMVIQPDSDIARMLRADWLRSFEDLSNLMLAGKCPYFYLCSDFYTIFFKRIPSSQASRPHVQAYITPLSNNMGLEFNKLNIEFKAVDLNQANTSTSTSTSTTTTATTNNPNNTSSIDSGNVSDFSDLEDDEEGLENEDTSQVLGSWGISQQELQFQPRRRSCVPAGHSDTSSSQTSTSKSNIPLALVEGRNNIRKLVKFLQSSYRYTIQNVGKFACVPPTLLSPREFRLSTPQYPEVTISKNMIVQEHQQHSNNNNVASKSSSSSSSNNNTNDSTSTPMKPRPKSVSGSSFVEISGPIIPNFYKELHKLLTISDNVQNHICQSNQLKSTLNFGRIQELP